MAEIAYIISMPHGIDRWTFREVEALQRNGVNIVLYPIRYGDGPYMPPANWRCFRLRRWRAPLHFAGALLRRPNKTLRLLSEALKQHVVIDLILATVFSSDIQRSGATHIHCVFGDHKLFVGYFCRQLLGLPLSVALYGYDLKANPNWGMFQKAIRDCASIVTNCDYNRRLVAEIVGSDVGKKVRVIRHHAEIPQGSPSTRLKLLIVGGFTERKGHEVLFKAIRELVEAGTCLEVWVAGYPGEIDVARLAKAIGIADRVRVFGAVSDAVVDLLYQECDLFCLPSRTDRDGISEGLPVALIEAMAHGKPVISTRLAGIPELVESILIDENDPAQLAAAIERYASDTKLREKDGSRNREIVLARYGEQNIDSMRRMFEEAAT